MGYNVPLMVAAVLSAIASLMHIAIVIGGAPWYRFFGAGERMAAAASAGERYPAFVTSGIAVVLMSWAAYALSAAGVLPALPLLGPVLYGITAVYLARGLVIVPLALFAPAKATRFWRWSSAVCLLYGAVHLCGLLQVRHTL